MNDVREVAAGEESSLELDGLLDRLRQTLAPYADTIATHPDETLPATATERDGDEPSPMRALARELKIEGTLGQGGMAIVHEATQLSMGRTVAVKALRDEHAPNGPEARLLLQEAWTTGALEHPNVVPVHEVGCDASGRPLIVLKRVAGTLWSEVMHHQQRLAELVEGEDELDRNLAVWLEVCTGISFAHSRGIVHRDIKPQNVMIGRFGEVYVLDWGIAVALSEEHRGWLPLAVEERGVSGTPSYMAPELLLQQAEALSERTDVYLLGALLYEILAGQPPHRGDDFHAIARSILSSRPVMPPDAPSDLVAICRRAMAREPAQRFASVEALRQQVVEFLEHRGSSRLTDEAERSSHRLLHDAVAATSAGAADESERIALYRLFGECRFGYREALQIWPDNVRAREGLRRAVEAMVGYELARGQAQAAGSVLADLDEDAPELAQRVEDALAAERAERTRIAELEQLGKQLDPRVGSRTRLLLGLVIGGIWGLVPAVLNWVLQVPEAQEHPFPLLWSLACLGMLGPVWLWARPVLGRTGFNRRISATTALLFVAQSTLCGMAMLLGVSGHQTLVLFTFLWATLGGAVSIYLDRNFLWPAITFAVGGLASARWPQLMYPVMSLGNFVLLAVVISIWRPEAGPRDRGSEHE